ncbi:MAG: response regulator transcription factor [Microthrixaceae bacterium]|nr:response regulator transcription factor [Microthrixaceae bacterium]
MDDYPIVREGLRGILKQQPSIALVGEASNGLEALDVCRIVRPDVVVMDLGMPVLGGIEATRELLRRSPGVGVLALTGRYDEVSVLDAIRAGARGYVSKDAQPGEVVHAICAVAASTAIFSSGVAGDVLHLVADSGRVRGADPFRHLTPRQRQVLDLLAAGDSNHEIARILGISAKTVANTLSVVFNKIQVTDRVQALIRAREAGLGDRTTCVPQVRSSTSPL